MSIGIVVSMIFLEKIMYFVQNFFEVVNLLKNFCCKLKKVFLSYSHLHHDAEFGDIKTTHLH